MPAVSTAAGFSPTARRRSPKRVLASTNQVSGTAASASQTRTEWPATMPPKRSGPSSGGVRPPCPYQALPTIAVSPAASMLMATPETIWLPRWLIAAKPCTSASATEAPVPAASPIQAESVAAAAAAAAKAATSILPSRPISTTPERSDHRPARQAARSGIESRRAESKIVRIKPRSMASGPCQLPAHQHAGHSAPEQSVERAGEQDDDASDHHHHVAGDVRLLEGQFRAALIENAEQEGRQDDAGRMGAAHERHRDADEAVAGGELEHQAVLIAHELVHREAARERARQH